MITTASLFSQLLKHIPRTKFTQLVKKHQAEHCAKGFTCWTQFVSMLFCHLAHADSLREICNGLSCCLGKLVHLGIENAPKRSTLAYANEHRPAKLYEDLFYEMLKIFRSQGIFGGHMHKFRFHNILMTLDSTIISLCLNLFPWAEFRTTKGGIKLHVLLDNSDYIPVYVYISSAKEHDVHQARLLNLKPGSIVVFDKAYNDYELFGRWTDLGVFFVTRMKDNASWVIVSDKHPVGKNIISDQIVILSGVKASEKCPHCLRRITVWDSTNERELVILTNNFDFAASTISAIYKERWQIEIFFKTLKQNLRIKSFVGTTENAIRIQIWTALIALLLLKWMHYISKAKWSFSNLAVLFRMNLFTYRDLHKWLDYPFHTPPVVPDIVQLRLPITVCGNVGGGVSG
jgi:hypothetical protein